jgi:Domain of unknown function (DUF4333)
MRRLITLMLAAAVLAGCSYSVSTGGSDDTIDPDTVEAWISEEMTKHRPDIPVNSVTCPDGIKPVQGATLECTAQLEGVQLPVRMTITNVDLGTGDVKFNIKPTKAILIPEGIMKAIKAGLRDQGFPNAKVDCGTERYRVVELGGAIECIVSAGGERRVVRAVSDPGGGDEVHFEDG